MKSLPAVFLLLIMTLASAHAFADVSCRVSQPASGVEFSSVTFTKLTGDELVYSVAVNGVTDEFGARPLTSTKVGYAQFVAEDQAITQGLWGAWNAPDSPVTYDVEDRVLRTGTGRVEVWGYQNEGDNPVAPATPVKLATLICE